MSSRRDKHRFKFDIPDSLAEYIKKNYIEGFSEEKNIVSFLAARRNRFSKSYLLNTIKILLLTSLYGKIRLTKLSELLNMNPGALYNYVRELEENGFLKTEKNGKKSVYVKADENTKKALIDLQKLIDEIRESIYNEYKLYEEISSHLNRYINGSTNL
ncbi:MAG: hypothetical protein B6U89_02150 [Desulfurococcales archaeon ex4484_58]|nr:MAG: hypothetical protein B6U89_02150 [Desulfurococcales archaeon ex4484_58]